MWNDDATIQDYLNFTVVAETVASLIIESREQPISIGISGNWGAGKSSLVNMIGEELKKTEKTVKEDKRKYVFLEFNAWLYQGYDDARTALMQSVSDKLDELVSERKPADGVLKKVVSFTKRIKWLQLSKVLLPLAAGLLMPGVAPAGAIAALLGSFGIIGDAPDKTKVGENVESTISAFNGILKDAEAKSTPRQVQELRDSFKEILEELKVTLVVLVDDLDRCLPSTAISTLEAMRLLLFVPRTAFVIAADEQMIRNGVKAHFNNVDLSDGMITSYFDKLIQIPLKVPHLGVAEIKVYLVLLSAELAVRRGKIKQDDYDKAKSKLVTLLRTAWQGGIPKNKIESSFDDAVLKVIGANIDMAEQLAGILVAADNIKGNPRLIKRFMNALIIREKVAELNGFKLDESSLVKILLFERCASSGAFEYLVKKADESQDGRLQFLIDLETKLARGEPYQAPDATWKSQFIESWLKLAPTLGSSDIRPLLYLSRDRSLALAAYDELSPEARDMLDALNQIDSGTMITALVDKLKNIGATESEMLLNRITRTGRTDQWEINTLYAALHITEAYPDLGSKLVNSLGEIPTKSLKAAYIPVLKDKSWAKEMLKQWGEDPETPSAVKNSITGATGRKK